MPSERHDPDPCIQASWDAPKPNGLGPRRAKWPLVLAVLLATVALPGCGKDEGEAPSEASAPLEVTSSTPASEDDATGTTRDPAPQEEYVALLRAVVGEDAAASANALRAYLDSADLGLDTLVWALSGPDGELALAAANVSVNMQELAPPLVLALARATSSSEVIVPSIAARALAKTNRAALIGVKDLLIASVAAGHASRSVQALLVRVGPSLIAPLLPLLDSDKELARLSATRILGLYGNDATEALPALRAGTADASLMVRVESYAARARIDPAKRTTHVEAMMAELDGADEFDTVWALRAIGDLGPLAASVVPALRSFAAGTKSTMIQDETARVLRSISK